MEESFGYHINLIVFGDCDVGKTCLIERFTRDTFTFDTAPTIGKTTWPHSTQYMMCYGTWQKRLACHRRSMNTATGLPIDNYGRACVVTV